MQTYICDGVHLQNRGCIVQPTVLLCSMKCMYCRVCWYVPLVAAVNMTCQCVTVSSLQVIHFNTPLYGFCFRPTAQEDDLCLLIQSKKCFSVVIML